MNSRFTDGMYIDAMRILEKLEDSAKLMLGETDDASIPSYGTSDENDKRYDACHHVNVTRDELKLSKEQFYAACDLIDVANNTVLANSCNDPNRDSFIMYRIYCGIEKVRIFCEYNRHNQQIKMLQIQGWADALPAPIALYPFAEIRKELFENMMHVFTGWRQKGKNLYQSFKSRDEFLVFMFKLSQLECAVKGYDRTFTLNMNQNRDLQRDFDTVTVDKSSLERAQKLAGFNGKPSELLSTGTLFSGYKPLNSVKQNHEQEEDRCAELRARI